MFFIVDYCVSNAFIEVAMSTYYEYYMFVATYRLSLSEFRFSGLFNFFNVVDATKTIRILIWNKFRP